MVSVFQRFSFQIFSIFLRTLPLIFRAAGRHFYRQQIGNGCRRPQAGQMIGAEIVKDDRCFHKKRNRSSERKSRKQKLTSAFRILAREFPLSTFRSLSASSGEGRGEISRKEMSHIEPLNRGTISGSAGVPPASSGLQFPTGRRDAGAPRRFMERGRNCRPLSAFHSYSRRLRTNDYGLLTIDY